MNVLPLLAATAPTWTLIAGGDLMLNGISPKASPFDDQVARVIRNADLAYANLEIPLTDQRAATPFKSAAEVKARSQFILKADPAHLKHLTAAGFDVFSLANNHAMDYRAAGLTQMTTALTKAGLGYAGAGPDRAAARRAAIITLRNGIRVALISYLAFVTDGAMAKCGPAGEKSAGIATLNLGGTVSKSARQRLTNEVAAARRAASVVLVALHWGIERTPNPIPYQISLAKAWIDAGADVVLGAHPHVLQGKQFYKEKPILYSLGNLVSPLPARTALYEIRFEGSRVTQVTGMPCDIRGGKLTFVAGKTAKARAEELAALDKLVGKPPIAPPKKKKPLRRAATVTAGPPKPATRPR